MGNKKNCKICESSFHTIKHEKFCGLQCRQENDRRRMRERDAKRRRDTEHPKVKTERRNPLNNEADLQVLRSGYF